MNHLLLLLLFGSTLTCAAAATPSAALRPAPIQPAPPGSRQPRVLHYRFDLRDPTHIHVTLGLNVRQPGAELLLLPSRWAGQDELFRAISNLRVVTPEAHRWPASGASLSPTGNPSRWLLQTTRAGPVSVAYDLTQDWSGPLKHPLEHRAILRPNLFEFTGENGLVAPAIPASDPVHVSFAFTGLAPPQILVTSFGTAGQQSFDGAWSEVRNALFTGGDLSVRTLDVEGSPVLLAIRGPWPLPADEVSRQIGKILAAERHLWDDTAIPFYAIVIAPYEDTPSGGGGSGFTHIFNLFLADQRSFTADTASLVAHEAFHQWNPSGLGAVDDTQQIAWFGEGFTSFYQDLILRRAGIIGDQEYIARLNLTIKEYLLSPRLHAGNADLRRMPPTDSFAYAEPYLRGSMIALWLNAEIRQESSGRYTLTDLLLALRAERSLPLTADRIFSTAARFVDAVAIRRLRAFAIDGVAVPTLPGSLGECVAFNDRPVWTFDLGFDEASLRPEGVVQGVQQGSNAYQAGVRDGQMLGGYSLWNGNAEREVTLTLREQDGKRERLSFLPRGTLLSIPQAEQLPGCPIGISDLP